MDTEARRQRLHMGATQDVLSPNLIQLLQVSNLQGTEYTGPPIPGNMSVTLNSQYHRIAAICSH